MRAKEAALWTLSSEQVKTILLNKEHLEHLDEEALHFLRARYEQEHPSLSLNDFEGERLKFETSGHSYLADELPEFAQAMGLPALARHGGGSASAPEDLHLKRAPLEKRLAELGQEFAEAEREHHCVFQAVAWLKERRIRSVEELPDPRSRPSDLSTEIWQQAKFAVATGEPKVYHRKFFLRVEKASQRYWKIYDEITTLIVQQPLLQEEIPFTERSGLRWIEAVENDPQWVWEVLEGRNGRLDVHLLEALSEAMQRTYLVPNPYDEEAVRRSDRETEDWLQRQCFNP